MSENEKKSPGNGRGKLDENDSITDTLLPLPDFSSEVNSSMDLAEFSLPYIDEAPEYTSSPKFLKNICSAADALFSKDLTETGSFDLRWISLDAFGKLLHAIPLPVMIVNAHCEIQLANISFENMCDDASLLHNPKFTEFFPGKETEISDLIQEALENRRPLIREGTLVLPFKEIWTRIHLRPIRFGNNRSILVLIEDLTVEKREASANSKYRKLVQVFPIGLAEFVLESNISINAPAADILSAMLHSTLRDANELFTIMHGKNGSKELIGSSLEDIIPTIEKDLPYYIEWISHGFSMTPFQSFETDEFENVHYYENTLVAKFESSHMVELWMMKQDITERVRVEQELLQKIRTIDELYEHIMQSGTAKAIAQHTANVAHELRQPLAIIGGFTRRLIKEVMQRDQNESELEELNIIIKEIQRLEKILGGLIDFSRKESLNVQPSSPNDLIAYILQINQNRLDDKQIRLSMDLERKGIQVPLDIDRFQQVIRNLVANAIEACHEGGYIKIVTTLNTPGARAHKTGALDAESYYEIRIENDGSRIATSDINRIFDPFYTTKDYGTGLGLTLAKKIVDDHNGSISVKSDQHCTVFTLWFPLV